MNLTDKIISLISSQLAAKAKIKSYPSWTTGSGMEKFYNDKIPWRMKIKKRAFELSNLPFLIKWLLGLRLYIYPKDENTRVIYLTGYYEPNEFKILDKLLKQGMSFLDAGANMGLYTIFASRKVGKSGLVIAIEPSSREFERLRANVKINQLKNVQMIQAAISLKEGEADLLVANDDHVGHNTLGNFAYDDVILKQKERVIVKTIDGIVSKLNLPRLDIIKMDIEGSEFFALQGAEKTLKHFKPILMIELFNQSLKPQGCDTDMIFHFLTSLGYIIYGFDELANLSELKKVDGSSSQNVFAMHNSSKIKWSE
ncbi:MAG: FkbM family methyltransferase [Nitrosotalea sp.]